MNKRNKNEFTDLVCQTQLPTFQAILIKSLYFFFLNIIDSL